MSHPLCRAALYVLVRDAYAQLRAAVGGGGDNAEVAAAAQLLVELQGQAAALASIRPEFLDIEPDEQRENGTV